MTIPHELPPLTCPPSPSESAQFGLVAALKRLLDSDPNIAGATDQELDDAVREATDPVVRDQAGAVLQARRALSHQTLREPEWHDAVLAECMKVEGAYDGTDPAKTIAALLNWHVEQAQEVSHTIKVQADSFEKMTCGAPQSCMPDLCQVIHWLEGGCNPIDAANELRAYQKRMGQTPAPILNEELPPLTMSVYCTRTALKLERERRVSITLREQIARATTSMRQQTVMRDAVRLSIGVAAPHGATVSVHALVGDVTTVLYSQQHPPGDSVGTFQLGVE